MLTLCCNHSVKRARQVSEHVIARAPARGNLPSTATGDCFVVALLAMTGSRQCSIPHISEWIRSVNQYSCQDSQVLVSYGRSLYPGNRRKQLRRIIGALVLATAFFLLQPPTDAQAGQTGRQTGPQLDHTLMGFKRLGAWYFLCDAPMVTGDISPRYVSYFPPPMPCGPMQYPQPTPLRKGK
jgi:hypothetical protein